MDISLTSCGESFCKVRSGTYPSINLASTLDYLSLSLYYQQNICGEHQPGRLQEGSAEDVLPATSEEVHFYTVTSSITICSSAATAREKEQRVRSWSAVRRIGRFFLGVCAGSCAACSICSASSPFVCFSLRVSYVVQMVTPSEFGLSWIKQFDVSVFLFYCAADAAFSTWLHHNNLPTFIYFPTTIVESESCKRWIGVSTELIRDRGSQEEQHISFSSVNIFCNDNQRPQFHTRMLFSVRFF